MHPLAWERFTNAPRVFFAIEGCIKSDAILSAGVAVLGVPSVTLWDGPEEELEAVFRQFRDEEVVIVADSDWTRVPGVLTQAMLCRSALRRLGLRNVVVAAPPDNGIDKMGVDDHLGGGRSLAALDVIDREVHHGRALEWLANRNGWRKDKTWRAAQLAECLALHADPNGNISKSMRSLAPIMAVRHHSRVGRGMHDLLECEAIIVDGSLSALQGTWHGNHFVRELEWENRPIITLHPDLRAETLPPRRLGGREVRHMKNGLLAA
jgi:hypothetical protein